MKMNHRHYILILFSLASVIFSLFVYVFIYKKTTMQADHYVLSSKEVENEDEKRKSERELVKRFNSTTESRSKLKSFFIVGDKVVDFIEQVEKIGDYSKTDLELSSISNSPGIVKAKVSVKGSWSGVMTALSLLENLPLSANLKNIRLDVSGDQAKGQHVWNLGLEIEVLAIQ